MNEKPRTDPHTHYHLICDNVTLNCDGQRIILSIKYIRSIG